MEKEDYSNFSDEELTDIFREEYPDVWFPVSESNRQTVIACLTITLGGRAWHHPPNKPILGQPSFD